MAVTLDEVNVARSHPWGPPLGLALAAVLAVLAHPHCSPWLTATLALCCYAGPIALLDLVVLRVHRRPSTGLDWTFARSWDFGRVGTKLVGLAVTLAAVALAWGLFPEYRGGYYAGFFEAVWTLAPFAVLPVLAWLVWMDRHLCQPYDGMWQVGAVVCGRWAEVDRTALGQHMLGWLVKGFFLPLMFTGLVNNIQWFGELSRERLTTPYALHGLAMSVMFTVDLLVATAGYLGSFRLLDTHVRSTESTTLGWLAAVACYQPFWSVVGRLYLAYQPPADWMARLDGYPFAAGVVGAAILALVFVYVWATVAFGLRFSNLTHRGIVRTGPYRWVKHPAYLAKNLSWWLVSLPFLAEGGVAEAARLCALLLLVNGVYALRAWTEERHLSHDPAYRAYAQSIRERGLLAVLSRWGAALVRPGALRGRAGDLPG